MKSFCLIICILSILLGGYFALHVRTDVGVLCSIIVIQIGFVVAALGQIVDNTERNLMQNDAYYRSKQGQN